MSTITRKNIKRAIQSDCLNLINSYCQLNDPTFNAFRSEWKKMKFYNIFSIIMSPTDMIHTTIQIFHTCKKILSHDRPELERIGAIYLLYIIYFRQPARNFVKIEVSLKTFKLIDNFVFSLDESHKQVQFIYLKLLSKEAFRFVENAVYYGLEKFLNETFDYSEISFNEFSIKELFKNELLNLTHETAGNLMALKLLENNYNDVKKELNIQNKESGGKFEMSNFFSELNTGMDSIKKTLECTTSLEILGVKKDETESKIRTKRLKIKKKASEKLVKSRNKNDIDESQRKPDTSTTSQNVECKPRRNANRFDEINCLLTENLPSEILKEIDEDLERGEPSCSKKSTKKK